MDDTSRRVEELRSEIEGTREEMSETIDAIQEKLRPSHIVAQATDRVKQATIEGVREMKDSATTTARDAISGNAVPLAMIGLGAAWLLINRTSHRDDYSYGRNEDGPYRYQWEREETARWRNTSAGHQYSTATDDFGVSPATMASVRQEPITERPRQAMRNGANRLQRMVRDNPILVGAGAMMLGAAFGMAVPETDVENEWMGEARDNMIDSAQRAAQNAAQKVQDTAGSLADAAGKIVTGGNP
jgi:hypothetical protein